MGRNEPEALTGGDFHYATDRIDHLVRSVGMLGDVESRRILVGQCRDGHAGFGIVFGYKAELSGVSHRRYIMAGKRPCDKAECIDTEVMASASSQSSILGSSKIVGFVGVRDAERARTFYRDTLGLRLVSEAVPGARPAQ